MEIGGVCSLYYVPVLGGVCRLYLYLEGYVVCTCTGRGMNSVPVHGGVCSLYLYMEGL